MPATFEKKLIGQVICAEEGNFNFSVDLINNPQQFPVRILCDTNFGIQIQLPAIADFQGAYIDLLIIISDITGNAVTNNILVLTGGGDSFEYQGGTGVMDKMGQTTTLRITTEGLWNVSGDGFTYGG